MADGEALLVDLASDIMACFLVATMIRARRQQVKRVFFLSRDASVLLRIWRAMPDMNPALAREFEGIETSELCVSRATMHPLSLASGERFLAEAASRVASLAGRNVTILEVAEHYGVVPPVKGDLDRRLPPRALCPVLEHAGLTQPLRAAIREKQELAAEYLRQEGALGCGPVLFADIGYSGTIAIHIAQFLLRERPDLFAATRVGMAMVATNSYLPQNSDKARLVADIEPGVVFHHEQLPAVLSDNFAWLECLFRDDARGALRSYRRSHGRVEPVFDAASIPTGGMRARFEQAAVRKLSGGLTALGYGAPARIGGIRSAAIAAFARPSPALVEAASGLWQDADGFGLASHPLVERVAVAGIPARLRHWKTADYWIAGCLVASGQPRLIDGYGLLKTGNRLVRNVVGLPRRAARRLLR